jgi:16S rRNA processing protein RimM
MSIRIVGKIFGYHGIKGEFKVYPLVDNINCFKDFDSIEINDARFTIKTFRIHKNYLILSLNEISDRNMAETLSGYIKAELKEELSDSEIYIDDLIGVNVYDSDNKLVGTVSQYSDFGQALITIKLDKSFSDKKELLLPFVEEYILDIAMDKTSIKVRITEDLLELAA